jgi:phosphate:Na+ symporter
MPLDLPEVALEGIDKEIDRLARKIEEYALLAIDVPPRDALHEGGSVEKLLLRHREPIDAAYGKMYASIRALEGEILRYATRLLKVAREGGITAKRIDAALRQTTYLATAAKSMKDMLHDCDRWRESEEPEAQAFWQNLRYQILRSVKAFDLALDGEDAAFEALAQWYRKIAKSYQKSVELIEEIVKSEKLDSEMAAIAINDLHLSKSFGKSLRNALRARRALRREEES